MMRLGVVLVFVVFVVLVVLASPLAAEAQPETKKWRIGYVSTAEVGFDRSWVDAFRERLRELGYTEGQNLVIEQRHAGGRYERLPDLAIELVRLKVDLLVVYGIATLLQGWKPPATLPIVFTVDVDPVNRGVVTSLARPGGNITGLSDTHSDLVPKRLELLKEVTPSATRIAVLLNPSSAVAILQLKIARTAAAALGLTLLPLEVKGPEPADIEPAFATIAKERPGGLLVIAEPTIGAHTRRIAAFAIKNRLPTVGTVRTWADGGFLMSYGTDFHDLWRRAANYVDKILKGAKPGDLPVEQPTKFDLVINLKTAKALGLNVPRSLLLRADHLIE